MYNVFSCPYLDQYIESINKRYKLGNATEHTFRGDLQQLIESLVPEIRATNEPKRQSCGAPDYILTKKDIPIGFIEAKDIGDKDLDGLKKTGNKEQFDRYKASLNNLIFTDYLNFHLYHDGEFVTRIAIAEMTTPPVGHPTTPAFGHPSRGGELRALPENFATFINLIRNFCSHIGQTIKSSKKLAEMMAGKARLLSDVIEKALTSDETNQEDSTLKDQMNAFREILIHDITPKGFADVYAQTIAYGMFAARLHDATIDTFSRQEAAELIPKSNPFLRKLFGYIAGPDLDDRIKWIVDSLVEIFLACNVAELLKDYGKATKMEDPIIHFYETFLSEYDPKLRKARGVWYTPQPVVSFIVRAVDDLLKSEFDLPLGLADTSKTKITTPDFPSSGGVSAGRGRFPSHGGVPEGRGGIEVHKVQILDPATGTGTFLAEVVRHIYKRFSGHQGIWSNYVETHLLPRLNGFELLMASYAMAHLKLDLLLSETGYKPTTPPFGHPSCGGEFASRGGQFPSSGGETIGRGGQFPSFGGVPNGRGGRLRVYLTNSLEEHHPDTGTLFANWLSTEANEANHIKRDTPVMVVMGNPPYSVSSSNKSEWIEKLTADYKKDLNERNIQPLSDDYIKFIRFGQHFIDKNGSGILAYISNNSFIDGLIHRQMRKHLLESFDKIYILDLHGNAKKKEVCPDGSPDQNVFDIMQGVSINIFIKTGKKKKNELNKVFHFDLQGKREFKYETLNRETLKSIEWSKLEIKAPSYFLVPKNFTIQKEYDLGFELNLLFPISTSGIKTHNDQHLVSFDRFTYFNYKYHYRVFDDRFICYDLEKVLRHRFSVMKNLVAERGNISLITTRQESTFDFQHVFISKLLVDINSVSLQTKEISYCFPLYLYPETNTQQTIGQTTERTPNLNLAIVKQIAEKLGLNFVPEKNSPPLEGCPKGGVVNSPPMEEWQKAGVVNSPPVEGCPTGGVVINNIPIIRNFVENLPHNPLMVQRAKEKRKAGILSEVLFWQQVHKGVFHNIDFDRQRIIGNYIVDFYVKTLGLVIEIDGNSHDEKVEYDAKRQLFLESLGLRVYRIQDIDVKKNLEIVMQSLENYIVMEYGETSPPCGHPSSGGELTTPACGHPSKGGEFAPIDLLDYIYAVLHSPTYREKYKEFLKIDFPRVPFPIDTEIFWQLVKLGGELRQIHLLESPVVDQFITQYPVDGDNVVVKIRFSPPSEGWLQAGVANSPPLEGCPSGGVDGRVYINDTQYFDHVPEVAWNFYIGGYQPAQKWLKDRKERKLEFEDILHYQKIIVALTETARLMNEIDQIEIE